MQRTRQTITATSPAAASTVVGTIYATGLDACDSLTIIGELAGATGGTLDVYLQTSFDEGTTWYDFAHFTQLAAGAAAIKHAWHVSRASERTTITTVGKDGTPALAAGTILSGGWGNMMRHVFVAGASTSAGAAQTIKILGIKNLH
jgi:hypothetical protein